MDEIYRVRHKVTKEYLYTNKGAWLKECHARNALRVKFWHNDARVNDWEIVKFTLVEEN